MCLTPFMVAGLLAAAAAQTAAGLPAWPIDLDTAWQAQTYASDSGMTIEEYVEVDTESELSFVLSREINLVGTAESVKPYWRDTTIYTAVTVDVEECLKGNCGSGSLTMSIYGGTIGDHTMTVEGGGPPWSGPSDMEPPCVGDRCVFLIRRDSDDPSFLGGGGTKWRYLIKEGQVVRKGIPLEDFTAVLSAYSATRTPIALFRASEAVVVGVVTSEREHRRSDILLEIEDVIKGDVAEGKPLRVALPSVRHKRNDCPRFRLGERVVLFLNKMPEGIWTITDGRDSKLRVLDDGTIQDAGSLADLVSGAQGAPPN